MFQRPLSKLVNCFLYFCGCTKTVQGNLNAIAYVVFDQIRRPEYSRTVKNSDYCLTNTFSIENASKIFHFEDRAGDMISEHETGHFIPV